MAVNIHLRGIENTLPATENNNAGAADILVGGVIEDGAMRPCLPPSLKFSVINKDSKLICQHRISGGTANYIFAVPTDTANTYKIGYVSESRATGTVDIKDYVNDTITGESALYPAVSNIVPIGNVLAILTTSGLTYAIYRDNGYDYIGEKPAFIELSFGLDKEGELDKITHFSKLDVHETGHTPGEGISGDYVFKSLSDTGRQKLNDYVLGLLNSSTSIDVSSKGKFWQPFLVRYAYRLYDGTHIMCSPLVLMPASVHSPLVGVKITEFEVKKATEAETTPFHTYISGLAQLKVPYYTLRVFCNGLTDSLKASLKQWKDIVTHIDIFVSEPLHTYDVKLGVDNISNESGFTPDRTMSYDYIGRDLTSNSTNYKRDNLTFTATQVYDKRIIFAPGTSLAKQCADCSSLFLYHSIDIEKDILNNENFGTDNYHIDLLDKDLNLLPSHKELVDDYFGFCDAKANLIANYNSRLIMADIVRSYPKPHNWCVYVPFTRTSMRPASARLMLYYRKNGQESSYKIDTYVNIANNEDNPDFLYFSDTSCYKAELFADTTSTQLHATRYEAKPHDFLGGAIYSKFNTSGEPAIDVHTSQEPVANLNPESLPSALYPSEVANPFAFPSKYSCSAGTDKVYAVASNTEALSQGQFGAHPLYAFTGSGIWALSVADDGTFNAVQPVSRDVVTNPNAVLPLAQSVLYCNSRGVLSLQGVSSELVSKMVDGDKQFAPISLNLDLSYLGHTAPSPRSLHFPPTLRKFVAGDIHLSYDYTNSQVIVTNSAYNFCWVLALKSGAWSMLQDTYGSSVNAYPDALLTRHSTVGLQTVLDIYSANSRNSSVGRDILYVSRPLTLGDITALKTITTIFAISELRSVNNVYVSTYGSNDLMDWRHLADATGIRFRGISGSPWRYYRIVIRGTLNQSDNISTLIVEAHQRFPNRLRF